MIGLNREQRDRVCVLHEHMGDEDARCRAMTKAQMTTMMITAAFIIDIMRPAASSSYGAALTLLCSRGALRMLLRAQCEPLKRKGVRR